jgi:hypothetical protein
MRTIQSIEGIVLVVKIRGCNIGELQNYLDAVLRRFQREYDYVIMLFSPRHTHVFLEALIQGKGLLTIVQ